MGLAYLVSWIIVRLKIKGRHDPRRLGLLCRTRSQPSPSRWHLIVLYLHAPALAADLRHPVDDDAGAHDAFIAFARGRPIRR